MAQGDPVKPLHIQAAQCWWDQCWARQMAIAAESIRDGALQETLALRRRLELALMTEASLSVDQLRQWLQIVENLHSQLADVGDLLNPPYAQEDLGQAIQHQLQCWPLQDPRCTVTFQAVTPPQPGTDWSINSRVKSALFVALNQLLRILIQVKQDTIHGPKTLAQIPVCAQFSQNESVLILSLSVKIDGSFWPVSSSAQDELEHLTVIFPVLTQGSFTYTWSAQAIDFAFQCPQDASVDCSFVIP